MGCWHFYLSGLRSEMFKKGQPQWLQSCLSTQFVFRSGIHFSPPWPYAVCLSLWPDSDVRASCLNKLTAPRVYVMCVHDYRTIPIRDPPPRCSANYKLPFSSHPHTDSVTANWSICCPLSLLGPLTRAHSVWPVGQQWAEIITWLSLTKGT